MNKQQGFSLIELAIVLVIVTLLVGGLAMPLTAQIQARRIAETRKIMEEAREAITGYTMTHFCQCVYAGSSGTALVPGTTTCTGGCQATNPSSEFTTLQRHYLPCPDTDFDGLENRTAAGTCVSPRGLFPFVELGTANQDAWGNHLHYSVTPEYANRTVGFGLTNASPGDIQVCNTNGCPAGTFVATAIPALLVSYGPNGWGARNVNGNTLSAPTSLDEIENTDDTFYVSRIPTHANAGAGEFDDLVVWISTPTLIDRVCLGRCP